MGAPVMGLGDGRRDRRVMGSGGDGRRDRREMGSVDDGVAG